MKNYIKLVLFIVISLSNLNLFSQDTDGDGVLDTTEASNGTNINDSCDYNVADVTVANTAGQDCDGDGVLDVTELANGTDPHDACSYNVIDITFSNTAGLDCDGDGVLDATEIANGTNPHDPCSYNFADVTVANTAGQDCDGDGVLDATELLVGTDPHNSCDYNVADVTIANTAWQDCDGDGVLDATEIAYGTDPHDPCSYNFADVTEPNTAGQDCDGDGVLDATELANGTNPHDSCDYNVADVTEGITAGQDCDADGVLDLTEYLNGTDPHDPCSYNVIDITLPNTAGLDCDGDGVNDVTEFGVDGTDPHDICDFNVASLPATPPIIWRNKDCDGDGVTNKQEIIDATDPLDFCDFTASSITLVPTSFCNIITGNVFLDVNQDGCGNADDVAMQNITISATDGTTTYNTNVQANGSYELHIDQGNYTIIPNDINGFYTFTPNNHTANFVGANNTSIADFCATGILAQDVYINGYFINGSPRPGFNRTYRLYFRNLGIFPVSSDVTLIYETSKLNFLSASPTENSINSGTLSFNYNNLQPLEQRYIDVHFNVTANIGDVLHLTATINPIIGDTAPNTNVNDRYITVIGSYDPNDINILEGAQIDFAKKDDYLHYLIRFQNTGTADAINVLVSNVLDANLDWDTFQLESSSHPVQVAKENEAVNFIFENIHLPDENTDEAGSHGYISYKIKPVNNISLGDVINNQANIYFDFNEAIVTNIATTTFVTDTNSVNDTIIESINIYPNPVEDSIQIETTATIKTVLIYNYFGQLILKVSSKSIDASKLDQGVYLLKVIDNNGNIAMKKFLKK